MVAGITFARKVGLPFPVLKEGILDEIVISRLETGHIVHGVEIKSVEQVDSHGSSVYSHGQQRTADIWDAILTGELRQMGSQYDQLSKEVLDILCSVPQVRSLSLRFEKSHCVAEVLDGEGVRLQNLHWFLLVLHDCDLKA